MTSFLEKRIKKGARLRLAGVILRSLFTVHYVVHYVHYSVHSSQLTTRVSCSVRSCTAPPSWWWGGSLCSLCSLFARFSLLYGIFAPFLLYASTKVLFFSSRFFKLAKRGVDFGGRIWPFFACFFFFSKNATLPTIWSGRPFLVEKCVRFQAIFYENVNLKTFSEK